MVSPAWREIPYEKRWIPTHGSQVQASNFTGDESIVADGDDDVEYASQVTLGRWTKVRSEIEDGLLVGMLQWSADQTSEHVPRTQKSATCPTREEVLNTAQEHRWTMCVLPRDTSLVAKAVLPSMHNAMIARLTLSQSCNAVVSRVIPRSAGVTPRVRRAASYPSPCGGASLASGRAARARRTTSWRPAA